MAFNIIPCRKLEMLVTDADQILYSDFGTLGPVKTC